MRKTFVDWQKTREVARKFLDMIGADLDLETPVEQLSTGEQQLVEIAKALRQATPDFDSGRTNGVPDRT